MERVSQVEKVGSGKLIFKEKIKNLIYSDNISNEDKVVELSKKENSDQLLELIQKHFKDSALDIKFFHVNKDASTKCYSIEVILQKRSNVVNTLPIIHFVDPNSLYAHLRY